MDDFDPMRYGFQDCAFLDMDETGNMKQHNSSISNATTTTNDSGNELSPGSSNFTPSPQEILSGNFGLEPEWNVDQYIDIDDALHRSSTSSTVNNVNTGTTTSSIAGGAGLFSDMSSPGRYSSYTSDSDNMNGQSPSLAYDGNGNLNYITSANGNAGNNAYPLTPPWNGYQQQYNMRSPRMMQPEQQQQQNQSQQDGYLPQNIMIKQEPVSPSTSYGFASAVSETSSSSKSPLNDPVRADNIFDDNTAVNANNGTVTPGSSAATTNASRRGPARKGAESTGKVTKQRKEKTSHNMIEKRYRTNINQKILALRNCVPSLRCVVTGDTTGQEELDLEGLTPASKLNKATVLTKATEYIMHLQNRNSMLLKELNELKTAMMSGSIPMNAAGAVAQPSAGQQIPDGSASSVSIPRQSNVVPKAMMCSMAGLMTASSLVGSGAQDTRGLSAAGPGLLGMNMVAPMIDYLRVAFIFGTAVYVLWPVFCGPSREAHKKPAKFISVSGESIPEQTWLTVSRSMWIPDKNSSLVMAVTYIVVALVEILGSMAIGVDGYKFVSRLIRRNGMVDTPDSFMLRAIDAQLCGGDRDCTRLRLFGTFLRSFLLSPTVKRYMLQSVHARVLTHDSNVILRYLGFALSRRMWAKAQHKARRMDNKPTSDMPRHLLALLTHDCDDVLKSQSVNVLVGDIFRSSDSTSSGLAGANTSSGSALDVVARLYANTKLDAYLVNTLQQKSVDSSDLSKIAAVCPDAETKTRAAIASTISTGTPLRDLDDSEEESDNDKTVAVNRIYSSLTFEDESTQISVVCAEALSKLLADDEKLAISEIKTRLQIPKDPETLGVLGFACLYKLLTQIHSRGLLAGDDKVEKAAGVARLWIGSESAEVAGIALSTRRKIVTKCVRMSAHFGGLDLDEGYSSH